MHLISIIIPVYNSEKYLIECLDSVLVQIYPNFEVLVINDGSTDNSGKIIDDYAAKDSRFKVFHKKNGGVSSARNLGLQKANGEWICFVDSDDIVFPNYLEDFQHNTVAESVDLIIQGVIKKQGDTEYKICFDNREIKADDYHELFKELEIFDYGYPFSKLFKTNIIKDNHIVFPEDISLAEDLLFLLQYIHHCSAIHFVNKENYVYCIEEGTLSSTKKKPVEYFNRYFRYKDILKNKYKPLFNSVLFNKKYQSLNQSLGSALYVAIESMYGSYALPHQERLLYFQKIDKEDLSLLSFHNYKKQNVFFKLVMKVAKMGKGEISDFLFHVYFIAKKRRNCY